MDAFLQRSAEQLRVLPGRTLIARPRCIRINHEMLVGRFEQNWTQVSEREQGVRKITADSNRTLATAMAQWRAELNSLSIKPLQGIHVLHRRSTAYRSFGRTIRKHSNDSSQFSFCPARKINSADQFGEPQTL